jgi:hypothetical protein
MLASWELNPPPGPDIVLKFLVVGENNVRLTPEHISRYEVILQPSAMDWVRRIVSGSPFWGGKGPQTGVWSVGYEFCHRTLNSSDGDPQTRYGGANFDLVVISYDPQSPQKSFELVWTKVRPGLLLCHTCFERIGH